MSILAECATGWILSHPEFFSKIILHENSENPTSVPSLLKLNPNLFDIKTPFVRPRNRNKNKRISVDDPPTTDQTKVSKYFTELIKVWPSTNTNTNIFIELEPIPIVNGATEGQQDDNNARARLTATTFFEDVTLDYVRDDIKFSGANTTDFAVISKISGYSYIFPEQTTFYCGNIHEVIKKEFVDTPKLFDFILMDPPWKNKYIWRNNKRRRGEGGGYHQMYNPDIGSIPVDKISTDGAIIVVWCTNALAHQNDLIKNFFPRWNVTYLSTWYWVKVTRAGEPVCPFNSPDKKQPYETIIIGQYQSPIPTMPIKVEHGATSPLSSNDDMHPDLRSTKVIASVPSSIHSHKPPLIEIFNKYLKSSSKCCELFARYLIPRFTSIGNEVTKLQHASLYVNAQDITCHEKP